MIEKKKYTKKVVPIGEASSAEERAKRLRRVRNMANLSRERMCSDDNLNINTYKGWEIARYGGLPVDGAERVIQRVAQEGVVCTLEWLLHGQGAGPYVMPSTSSAGADAVSVTMGFEEQTHRASTVFDELMLFKKRFSHAIATEIKDDGLAPWYRQGDFVAGIKHYGDQIRLLVGECCLVETSGGETMVRRLKEGNEPNKYILVCTNSETSNKRPVIYDAILVSAAPIIRHYRAPF